MLLGGRVMDGKGGGTGQVDAGLGHLPFGSVEQISRGTGTRKLSDL